MISWGLKVNDYGNALRDEAGDLIKMAGQGVEEPMWEQMVAYARQQGWKAGEYKKLNLPFENRLLAQPQPIRERMTAHVRDFAHAMMVDVFNARDTAPLCLQAILEAGGYDPGPKARRTEDPAQWTPERIAARAAGRCGEKGPQGNFDD
jgi:hypothetical protein